MEEQTILGQEIVVSASRAEEAIMQSPVSIEKMDILGVQNTASENYYKGLINMKGLDMAALQDPNWKSTDTCHDNANLAIVNGSASAHCYVYAPTDNSGGACDNAGTDCVKYTLSTALEDNTTFSQNSLQ